MNILIIGSDSFIARHFISFLKDTDVKCISRTNSCSQNEKIFPDLFSIPDCEFAGRDIVYNFAAIVHRPEIKDENIYNEVNYKLAILNAQKAKKAGVRLFIQMSTIAVYGNASEISIDTPCNPQNPYGKSKLKADEGLLAMQDEKFKVAIVRPPMVYGGDKAPGNMMRLIKLVDKGIPLPFRGVNNIRDFIHVKNLIQYLQIIFEKQLNGIFLISDNEPVSTEKLIIYISKYLEKNVLLIKIPAFCLNILRVTKPNEFEKLFGTLFIKTNFPFEDNICRFTVEEGIKEMVEWHLKSKN
ncbi:MAG TPA: NAD-dependent epimerase/dehydratase family protein [Bacteroidales bacterium]